MFPKGIKLLVWFDGGDEGCKEVLVEPFYVLASPENGNRPCDFLLGADFVKRAKAIMGQGPAEVSMLSMVFKGSQNRYYPHDRRRCPLIIALVLDSLVLLLRAEAPEFSPAHDGTW